MRLYQLEDGTLINLEQMCAILPSGTADGWDILLANGARFALTLDDARNLMDHSLLDFEFMAE